MAMDILFKPRVEATEQMAHNGMENFAIQESKKAQNRVQVTFIITVCSSYFLFQFYLTPENLSWGNLSVESSSAAIFRKYMKEMSQVLLSTEFILDIDGKILR